MNIIGNIKNKNCIFIDDLVDSAGTLCNAAKAVIDNGAKTASAYITHGVLSGKAISRLADSKISNLIITDTIDNHEKTATLNNVRIVSAAPLIATAIERIADERSISILFD